MVVQHWRRLDHRAFSNEVKRPDASGTLDLRRRFNGATESEFLCKRMD